MRSSVHPERVMPLSNSVRSRLPGFFLVLSSLLPGIVTRSSCSVAQLSILSNLNLPRPLIPTANFGKLVGGRQMLWTLFVILLVLWLIGVVSSYTLGVFIHLLLVLALVALVSQLLTGRRTAL